MPTKDPNIQHGLIDWFLIAIAIAFATLGGMAKYLADVQEGKEMFTWVKLAIQGFISAFAGSIATLYLLEHQFSTYMIVLGSGIFGFGGVVLLRMVVNKISRHFSGSNANSKEG